jgi:hypothetical protein
MFADTKGVTSRCNSKKVHTIQWQKKRTKKTVADNNTTQNTKDWASETLLNIKLIQTWGVCFIQFRTWHLTLSNIIVLHLFLFCVVVLYFTITSNYNKVQSIYIEFGYIEEIPYPHQSLSWSWSHGSWLDLQLPMQSVPITSVVVCSNPDQCEVYKIMW